MNDNLIILPEKKPKSVFLEISHIKEEFRMDYGTDPTKLFLSVDLCFELLAEVLPGARKITENKNAKNEILGMVIYRVIEPDVIICAY